MRRIVLSMMVTLDGYAARPDGDMDVFGENFADDELLGYLADQLRSVDAYVFGRVAYELLAGFWPTAGTGASSTDREVELAELMNSKLKIVVSKTLTDPVWTPATVIGGDLAAELAALKAEPGKDLALFAGATTASAVVDLRLVDEYRLMVYPIVVGKGQSPFRDLGQDRNLKLVDTRTFPSDVVLLRYLPQSAAT